MNYVQNLPDSVVYIMVFYHLFLEQLHVSLYGFILGLLDDLLLGELKIHFLSDTIAFDLVPSSTTFVEKARLPPKANTASPSSSGNNKLPTVPVLMTVSFLAGIGTGVLAVVSGNGTRSA